MARLTVETAAARGELDRFLKEEAAALKRAETHAVVKTANEVKLAARRRVQQAFQGSGQFGAAGAGRRFSGGPRSTRRLANTIRSVIYGRESQSGSTEALIFSKFGRRDERGFIEFFVPFTKGATLTPRRAKWLFIPLDPSLRRKRFRGAVTLDEKLAFIPAKRGGKIWLVRRTKTRSTLVAILVRQVRMPRLISFDDLGEERRLAENLSEALTRE